MLVLLGHLQPLCHVHLQSNWGMRLSPVSEASDKSDLADYDVLWDSIHRRVTLMPAKFIKSAVFPKDYPEHRYPEIAMLGRSNAGKSTLINAYVQQRIAKEGKTPGKTRLINFFLMDNKFVLVDLPGYGYAAVEERERQSWRKMVETYLTQRQNLAAAILAIEGRRSWSEDEAELQEWLKYQKVPLFIAVTKIDKLTQSEMAKRRREYEELGLGDQVFFLSGKTGKGVDKLRQSVYKNICDFSV
jgi:GTP-binding protein